MLSRYSHVRMEAKRRALDEIATRQNTADEKRKDDSERREQAAAVFQSAVVSNRRRGNVGRRLPEKGVQACPSAQFPRGAP
jgi:cation transport regulator ChaB